MSLAQTIQGIKLESDTFERDSVTDLFTLKGNVKISYGSWILESERAVLNTRNKTIVADGGAQLNEEEYLIQGSKIVLDYEAQTGLIYDGLVRSGQMIFAGDLIEKRGPREYLVKTAQYTTCSNCTESWKFEGSLIRAEFGSYAYIKNSILRLKGVPVLWLPYLALPLKSDRQTGLLTPEIESSQSSGLILSQSGFWAISRNQDATITLKSYEKRGLKTLVNYRYVLSESSFGELDFGYMRDRTFADEERVKQFKQDSPSERWFVKYNHYYELPENWTHTLSVNTVSDTLYSKDFLLEPQNLGDPAAVSRMSLTKRQDDYLFTLDSSIHKNLLSADPLGKENFEVDRVPEITILQKPKRLGSSDLLFSWSLQSTRFARNGYAYDDLNSAYLGPNSDRYIKYKGTGNCLSPLASQDASCILDRDGAYNPGVDLLRVGERLDFNPKISLPIKLNKFLIEPEISYRHFNYSFPVGDDSNASRKYLRGQIRASTQYYKIFESEDAIRWKHEIIPEVSFSFVPWLEQDNHPFFGSQQETPFFSKYSINNNDLNSPYGIQFDFNDRLFDRKILTYSFLNKWTRKTWSSGRPVYSTIATWKVSQTLDVFQQEQGASDSEAWSDISSEFKYNLNQWSLGQTTNYFHYLKLANTNSSVRYDFDSKEFIGIEHSLAFPISAGTTTTVGDKSEEYSLRLGKKLRYIKIIGKLNFNPEPTRFSDQIKSWGYTAQLALPGDCWFINFTQYQVPKGDTTFRLSFDFFLDGKNKPEIQEELLSSYGF